MHTLTLTALDTAADVAEVRAVLAEYGLRPPVRGALLVDEHGARPSIGGVEVNFEASFLGEGARDFYGSIFRATPETAQLTFDLASRGNLLVTVSPGPPHIIVCGGTPAAADITDETVPPWLEVVCFVDSAGELCEALAGGWRRFRSTLADRYWGGPEEWPDEFYCNT